MNSSRNKVDTYNKNNLNEENMIEEEEKRIEELIYDEKSSHYRKHEKVSKIALTYKPNKSIKRKLYDLQKEIYRHKKFALVIHYFSKDVIL